MDADARRVIAAVHGLRTMDPSCVMLAVGAAVGTVAAVGYVLLTRRTLLRVIEDAREELSTALQHRFAVQPCFRCYESEMRLLEVSPNGRSVHYQCTHCKKNYRAPAGTPDAPAVVEQLKAFAESIAKLRARGTADAEESAADLEEVRFHSPALLLPFEQTTRTPIPEAVRSEVWRRDGGQCAKCGSKHNLQFDHVIPVSRGGANSVANIQLLCLPCNAAKGDQV